MSLHAQQLLTSAHVTATPDLALNTVSHFLDRFVYKNPKKPKPRGASAMQPAASKMSGAGGAVRLIRGAISGPGDTMNEESFWKKPAEDIPVDQVRAFRGPGEGYVLVLRHLPFTAVFPQVLYEQT